MIRVNWRGSWRVHLHSSIIISRSQKVWGDVSDPVYWCTFPYSVLLGCVLISGYPLVHGKSSISYLRSLGINCAKLLTPISQCDELTRMMVAYHRDFPLPTDQRWSPRSSIAKPRHDLLDGLRVNL